MKLGKFNGNIKLLCVEHVKSAHMFFRKLKNFEMPYDISLVMVFH